MKPFQRTKAGRRAMKKWRLHRHRMTKAKLASERLTRWFATGKAEPIRNWVQRRYDQLCQGVPTEPFEL